MKILNLVIHNSEFEIYESMYKVLSRFYKNYKFVDTFFIEQKENLNTKYKITEDRLIINGKESIVPGLLNKTIESMQVLNENGMRYDWVVRSNVSTVIDFSVVKKLLTENRNLDYFSGCVTLLNSLNVPHGISDQRYFGTLFAHGTFIGMSKDLADIIVNNRKKLDYEVVDDVAIGVFVSKFMPETKLKLFENNRHVFSSGPIDLNAIRDYHGKFQPVAWRNKSEERNFDIENMIKITEVLSQYLL